MNNLRVQKKLHLVSGGVFLYPKIDIILFF